MKKDLRATRCIINVCNIECPFVVLASIALIPHLFLHSHLSLKHLASSLRSFVGSFHLN
jgi:hypothetical protein